MFHFSIDCDNPRTGPSVTKRLSLTNSCSECYTHFYLTIDIKDQKYALLPKEDGDVKQSASSSDKPEAENWDNDW